MINQLNPDFKDEYELQVLEMALQDSFYVFRQSAIDYMAAHEVKSKKLVSIIETLVSDPNSNVRASALLYLAQRNFSKYRHLLKAAMDDRSYMVAGSALSAYIIERKTLDEAIIERFTSENNIQIILPLAEYFYNNKINDKYDWFVSKVDHLKGTELFYFIQSFSQFLIEAQPTERSASVSIFEKLARNDNNYIIRFSAYQALMLMTDLKGVRSILSDIRRTEKDQRLLQIYNQM